jgi:aspartate kinase
MPSLAKEYPWVVQKYGGTSLGKLLPTITGSIIPQYLQANNVTVVCSAISGTTKSSGTTSLLLQAIKNAIGPQKCQKSLNGTIDTIRDEHLRVSERLFLGCEEAGQLGVRRELDDGVVADCEDVRRFLVAAQVFIQ